ncbi:MAG: glycosyltransferase family 2 protein [Pyrinomonadaceae bacterium]
MPSNLPRQSISVFFPAYNDARSIGKLVADALEILPALTDDYEIIVVNDGSGDETANVLRDLQSKHKILRVVEHETNKGYGAALRSGFGAATKDLVFYTDGDGQYDARELPALFALLDEKTDVVNGFKLERADKINRKIIGNFYNWLAHFLFSLPIRDVDCDFRLIRREFLCKIRLFSTSGSICVELVYKLRKAGARFAETGVNHYQRPFGKSQFFTVRRVVKTLLDFFSLWFKFIILGKNQ